MVALTSSYIFHSNIEWKLLKNACLGLIDHTNNPAAQVCGAVVSFLHDPMCLTDGSLVQEINRLIPPEPNRDAIISAAFTLFMYMYQELQLQNLHEADAYTLISSGHHLQVELWKR